MGGRSMCEGHGNCDVLERAKAGSLQAPDLEDVLAFEAVTGRLSEFERRFARCRSCGREFVCLLRPWIELNGKSAHWGFWIPIPSRNHAERTMSLGGLDFASLIRQLETEEGLISRCPDTIPRWTCNGNGMQGVMFEPLMRRYQEGQANRGQAGYKPWVMAIDCDRQCLGALLTFLESAGYRVIGAAEVENGLEVLARRIPDLLILNYSHIGLDGLALIRIMAAPEFPALPLPVLVISARSSLEEYFREVGILNGFLSKPFGGNELLTALAGILADPAKKLTRSL